MCALSRDRRTFQRSRRRVQAICKASESLLRLPSYIFLSLLYSRLLPPASLSPKIPSNFNPSLAFSFKPNKVLLAFPPSAASRSRQPSVSLVPFSRIVCGFPRAFITILPHPPSPHGCGCFSRPFRMCSLLCALLPFGPIGVWPHQMNCHLPVAVGSSSCPPPMWPHIQSATTGPGSVEAKEEEGKGSRRVSIRPITTSLALSFFFVPKARSLSSRETAKRGEWWKGLVALRPWLFPCSPLSSLSSFYRFSPCAIVSIFTVNPLFLPPPLYIRLPHTQKISHLPRRTYSLLADFFAVVFPLLPSSILNIIWHHPF